MDGNALYYGDCLDWMREWPDGSVDLIYLDPPFNSNATYNIIFGAGNGTPAQVRGFADTWKWDEAAAERAAAIESAVSHPLHDAVAAFRRLLGPSGMLAYLTSHNDPARYGRVLDHILYYQRGERPYWDGEAVAAPRDDAQLAAAYPQSLNSIGCGA